METLAPGTGPPFSSVTSPESVAPETCPRVVLAQKSIEVKSSDTHIHFAKEELQPLFVIMIPPSASPRFRFGPDRVSTHPQKSAPRYKPAASLSGECARNQNRTQYSMYPIENLSTSSTLPLKMQELALEVKGRLSRYQDPS